MSSKKQREKYLFDINDYKIIKEINKGGFGVINLVQNKKDGMKYAAKTNLIQHPKQSKLYISREVRILIEVQHQTITRFQGFSYVDFDKKNNITILMDYMNKGSLSEIITKESRGLCPSEYDNTIRQIILIGISRGMMLLHKLHIIHRNLKPENILLDDDLYPHVSDFGLSKFFHPLADIWSVAYMAPEVISADQYSTKSDVYAFGILMYEVLTGKRAYKNLLHGENKLTVFQFKQKVCEGLRPEIEKGSIKMGLQTMIEKCLSKSPRDRPTFSELYRKLSLSTNDFLDFEGQQEQNVIEYEERCDFETEIGINTAFCLDEVNYEEVLDYVDAISNEPRRYCKFDGAKESSEEINGMKQAIKNLEQKNKEQESEIFELRESVTLMKEEIGFLKNELKKARSEKQSDQQFRDENLACQSEYGSSAAKQHQYQINDVNDLKYALLKINDEICEIRLEKKNFEEDKEMNNKEQNKLDINPEVRNEIMSLKYEIEKLKRHLNVSIRNLIEQSATSSSKHLSEILTEAASYNDDSSDEIESITKHFKESLDKIIHGEIDMKENQSISITKNPLRKQINDINELPSALQFIQDEIDEIQIEKKDE